MKTLSIGVALLGFSEQTGDYRIGHILYVSPDSREVVVLWSHDDAQQGPYVGLESFDQALLEAQRASEYHLEDVSNAEFVRLFASMIEARRAESSGEPVV